MRWILFAVLLAGGVLRAEQPWNGTWKVVWASASFDNESRMVIRKGAEGLELVRKDEAVQALRPIDDRTAEYTVAVRSHSHKIALAAHAEGRELTMAVHCPQAGVTSSVYDRLEPSTANGLTGVWVFNSAKSSLDGEPRVFESAEGGKVRFRVARGGYTAAFDGKEHPLVAHPVASTVLLKRIDERTFDEIMKDKVGKEVQVRRVAVSEDGSELKLTLSGTFPSGKGHRVLILHRQK
jgi:hypothetical protein